jgi:hypothetical protein
MPVVPASSSNGINIRVRDTLERRQSVPGLRKGLIVSGDNTVVQNDLVLLSQVMKSSVEHHLGLHVLARAGECSSLDWQAFSGLSWHIEERKGAVTGIGQVGGSQSTETGTQPVFKVLVNITKVVFDGESIVIWRAKTTVGIPAALHGSEDEQTLLGGLLAESRRILRDGRRQLGLERLERVASCLVGAVVSGDGALFENLDVFEAGIFGETMDDNPGFSGIRRRGPLKLVGGDTEVEFGRGGASESGNGECGKLHRGWFELLISILT